MSDNLTREQAVALVGEAAVEAAERENCEPTNRVGFNGSCQGDEQIEWAASAPAVDANGEECTVTCWYYTSSAQEEDAREAGWDSIKWAIDCYTVQ